jgi:hypothetical protein
VLSAEEARRNPDAEPVFRSGPYTLYKMNESLPFAFVVENSRLETGSGQDVLRPSEVDEVVAYPTTNTVEAIVRGPPESMLVVLVANYPGWVVRVDGHERLARSVRGHLAVDVEPGTHKYAFSFEPLTFKLGIGMSILSLIIVVWLVGSRTGLARSQP